MVGEIMKSKEIIFTNMRECPMPGCKRGYLDCSVDFHGGILCPEHKIRMADVFKDKQGKLYHYVWQFTEKGEGEIGE